MGNVFRVALSRGHRPGLLTGAFLAALLVQTAALYWPLAPSTGQGLPLDKVAHFVLFALVALTGVLAGIPLRWLLLLLVVQAVVSELAHHWWYVGRGGELGDVIADALGATAGIAAGLWWRQRSEPTVRSQ